MKRVFIFINGILTDPGDAHGWTDRAVAWIQTHTNEVADRYEYFSGALTRRLFQNRRVAEVVEMIDNYSETHDVVLVGHSNGCDIILRALQRRARAVNCIHLFAAAAEADCRKSGLNQAMKNSPWLKVFITVSRGDEALRIAARTSHFLFGWLGLGYGDLGYEGPSNVYYPERIKVLRCDSMNHGEWFRAGDNFEYSMRAIVAGGRS